MRTTRVSVAVASGILAATAWACTGANSGSAEKPRTFTVISHHDEKTFTEIDNVAGDFAVGDAFVGTEELTDEAGKHLGVAYYSGSAMPDGMALNGVLRLPDGKIVIGDVETEAERTAAEGEDGTPISLPVLGGTGKYDGARGHADFVFLKSDTNAAKLTFHLS